MNQIIIELMKSWDERNGNVNTTQSILEWIKETNDKVEVHIEKVPLSKCDPWYYDYSCGVIQNPKGSFFYISGIQEFYDDELVKEQPIIIQNEIGFLGIICKMVDGVLNFLMQAKIEPGNVNKVQISPTIQATKSNFTQKHGGRKPAYLEYFVNARKHEIIVDQIQSEQSSRFYKKRNRNIIILVEDEVEVLPSHKWMTLGQIKQLMRIDNLVNMDARTVLSCIPLSITKVSLDNMLEIRRFFKSDDFYRSIFDSPVRNRIPQLYSYINDYKMFRTKETKLIPLFSLKDWQMKNNEFYSPSANFKIVFCDIKIQGREVTHWAQPLFEAIGKATFGLFMSNIEGVRNFLVQIKPEIGCFDQLEIGPTVQLESNFDPSECDIVTKLFLQHLENSESIHYDVILSEEGGRFYCEQNRNVIIEINYRDIDYLPEKYQWVDYATLNTLVQVNNCLNIQLRNLLALLEV